MAVGTYYKKLGSVIMEANKSQDLWVANWRARRTDGLVPAQKLAGSRPNKNTIDN